MEERQLRLLTILAVVLLALVALYSFWEPSEDDPAADPEATALVWELEPDAVTRLAIVRPDVSLVFEKGEDGWFMTEPFAYQADTWKVEQLLDELGRIEKGVPIEDGDPEQFGLGEPPVAHITATTPEGDRVLVVGEEAPVGWKTYVRTAAGGVAAVDARIAESIEDEPGAWRDMRVVRFEIPEVKRVRIEGPEGTLDLHRDATGWWLEGFTRADPDAVEDLLMAFLDVRFDKFHDEPGAEPIGEPVHTVSIEREGAPPLGLRVGETTPIGTLVEVDGGARGVVFPESLSFLRQGPRDLGDRTAFPAVGDAVVAVRAELGGRNWRVERGDPRWDDLVSRLDAATIAYWREAPPAPARTWGSVVYEIEGGEERGVRIGEVVDEAYRTVVDTAGGSPYRVPVEGLERVAGF